MSCPAWTMGRVCFLGATLKPRQLRAMSMQLLNEHQQASAENRRLSPSTGT
jgi:hypothetical protein